MGKGSPLRNCLVATDTATSRCGSGKSSGRSSTPLTSEKIAVLAPMPMAKLSTDMAAKPRSFQSVLNAYFMYESLRPCRRADPAPTRVVTYEWSALEVITVRTVKGYRNRTSVKEPPAAVSYWPGG